MSLARRVVGLATLLLALTGSPMSIQRAQGAEQGDFSAIAGCISGANNVLVSIVVDESLSLRKTDPNALRVKGITTAIDSLEQLAATVDKRARVQVNLSTFARSYRTLVNWTTLNAHAARDMRATAARALPGRDAGDATDYRQALLGAKHDLDSRQKRLGDPAACKVILWFTDGALDVDNQTESALSQLCQVGGIADAVREDGIAVVAVALFTAGAGVTNSQRDQLRAVAEGSSGPDRCGTAPIPTDSSGGVYLSAADPASLQRLFAGAGALVAGATEVGTVRCPTPACRGGVYRLAIDAGVARARVLVQSSASQELSITTPSGSPLRLMSGQSRRVDGATVSYLARGSLATIDVAYDPYARETSIWSIRPSGRAQLSVYWFWGAQLTLRTTELRAGNKNDIALQLTDQNGKPLAPSLYRRALVSLKVGNKVLKADITPAGVIRGSVRLGVQDIPSKASLSASMTVTSVPNGVRLGPLSLSASLPVTLPPSYPVVSPKELDFGRLEGLGTASAGLRIVGSELGPTRVCFKGSSVIVPGQQAKEHLVRTSRPCIALQRGQSKVLPLDLRPDSTADGIATGTVRLGISSADGSPDLNLSVPARLDMARQIDQGARWELIAALLALAVLFPLALLVGSNLLLGRFSMTSTSRTAWKHVTVTSTGLQPHEGDVLLAPEDFRNAPFSGKRTASRMSIERTEIRLKARRILSMRDPEGVAVGPPDQLLVSSAPPHRMEQLNEAPVALGEVDATFVILNPVGATTSQAEGTLVMHVPEAVDRSGIAERADRMNLSQDWPKVLGELVDRASTSTPVDGEGGSAIAEGTAVPSGGVTADDMAGSPWGWATSDPPADARQEQPTPSRFGKSRRARKPQTEPLPPSPQADDELPPVPDFLK